jgi:hypothetical protein
MKRTPKSLGDILDYKQTVVSQSLVRRAYERWRAENSLPNRCDHPNCQFHSPPLIWNGAPLKLILDHIDGNKRNNRTSNLRFLCPNCDSQLPTRGGGNIGRIRDATTDSYRVVERDGTHETKVMLWGLSATFGSGKVTPK